MDTKLNNDKRKAVFNCRCFKGIRDIIFILFCMIVSVLFVDVQAAIAQQQELTSADDHALLYAKQMQFASDGSPVVRMRIGDGLTTLTMTPEHDFIVYPNGPGRGFVTLPGKETYTVTAQSPQAGEYRYAVILYRARHQEDLSIAATRFQSEVSETEKIALGSIFALKGKVFDNREHLLLTSKTDDRHRAIQTLERLKAIYPDEDFELYDELQAYPKLIIRLSNQKGDVTITNANLLWFDFEANGVTVHSIPDEQGVLRTMKLNGNLIVTPDSQAHLALVQAASVETVLRGIVPAEIFPTAPQAALEAQAIAARTTLISQVGSRHQADPYHLCNKQHCQVYQGLGAATRATDKAIEATRGRVLFSGDSLVRAYYSAHCGGSSATANETWGLPDQSYLQAKTDDADHEPSPQTDAEMRRFIAETPSHSEAFCAKPSSGEKQFSSFKHAHWDVTVTSEEIKKRLKAQGVTMHRIENIEILKRGPSGRVTQMRIIGDGKVYLIERELPIRRFFGGLKSAFFVMDMTKTKQGVSSLTFHGAGFGHGVGLCQTGAIGMAQQNYTSEQILEHYYPSTHIEKLW